MKPLTSRIAATIAAISIAGLLFAAKIAPFADDVARVAVFNSDDAIRYSTVAKTSETADRLKPYSRDLFGYTTETRHETLKLHAVGAQIAVNERGRVTQGLWRDAYTGRAIPEVADATVDHVVSLRWAWDHGAHSWSQQMRQQFGNDRENLVVTAGKINGKKGSSGPGNWHPGDPQARRILEARQKWLLEKYGLE